MSTNPRAGGTLPLALLAAHPTAYFVETGTSAGHGLATARSLTPPYELIHTIDIDRSCWLDAANRYADEPRIYPFCGDTSRLLAILMPLLDKPTTFWLDAHDDGGPRGLKRCPLLDELAAIATSPIKEHVILIDDRRCLGAPDVWAPDITEADVRAALLRIRSDYAITLADSVCFPQDIIVAAPPPPQ